jgi:hypothetical protein
MPYKVPILLHINTMVIFVEVWVHSLIAIEISQQNEKIPIAKINYN